MPKMNIESKIVAFGDPTINSNPKLRYVDWTRSFLGLDVDNPRIQQYTIRQKSGVLVGQTVGSYAGTRLTFTAIDSSKNWYLATYSGGIPNTLKFEVDSGTSLTLSPVQDRLSLAFDNEGVGELVVGNSLYLSSYYGANNQGEWIVTSVNSQGTSQTILLVRDPSSLYSGSESKTIAVDSGNPVQFFAPAILPGTAVSLAGYTFPDGPFVTVARVRYSGFEFYSSAQPVDITSGITMFASTSPIRFLYVESDQPLSVKFDTDTVDSSGHLRLQPSSNGDETAVSTLLVKDTYLNTVSLYNNGTVPAKVTVITGE